MADGGVIAISGFFYQLLGSVADLADAPAAHVLRLETGGEDALIVGADGQHLYQFKFSADRDPIAPGDLAEILVTLQSNGTRYQTARWRLITNRPFSAATQAIWDGALHPPANVAPKNFDVIVQLRERLKVETFALEQFRERLESFGQQFGLTAAEVQEGSDKLVGWCMRRIGAESGAGATLTAAELLNQLIGFSSPSPLRREDLVTKLPREIDAAYEKATKGPPLAEVFPRSALASLWTSAGTVVVTGTGGVGKTSAVLRSLRDHVTESQEAGLVLFSTSFDDVCRAISRWRNRPAAAGSDDLDRSIARLTTANRGYGGNMLVVVFDGIDERGWSEAARRAEVASLLAMARGMLPRAVHAPEAPRIKVVITCRGERDLDEFIGRPGIDGPPSAEGGQTVISLRGFEDDREFALAWLEWCPRLPLPSFVSSTMGSGLLDRESTPLGITTARVELLGTLLRHPAMLSCFRKLGGTPAGEATQQAILAGSDDALDALLREFVTWFAEKAHVRGGFKIDWAMDALRAAAAATQEERRASYLLQEHWAEPVRRHVGADPDWTRRLFDDAVSSGMIERLDGIPHGSRSRRPWNGLRWRWRFAAVRDHLTSRLASTVNIPDEPCEEEEN